jgi:HTH-type transcriptional regulator/antitoxin HipB
MYTTRITGPETLGGVIQQARLLSGLSQIELARSLGISQRAVTEIETGKATIQTRRIFELLRACGVSLIAEYGDDRD